MDLEQMIEINNVQGQGVLSSYVDLLFFDINMFFKCLNVMDF